MFDSSEVSVNSALQRARATLETRVPAARAPAATALATRARTRRALRRRGRERGRRRDGLAPHRRCPADDASPTARVPGTQVDRCLPQLQGGRAPHAAARRAHAGQDAAGLRLTRRTRRRGSPARRTVRADARGGTPPPRSPGSPIPPASDTSGFHGRCARRPRSLTPGQTSRAERQGFPYWSNSPDRRCSLRVKAAAASHPRRARRSRHGAVSVAHGPATSARPDEPTAPLRGDPPVGLPPQAAGRRSTPDHVQLP